LEGLAMDGVGEFLRPFALFYNQKVYFMASRYILYLSIVVFFRFGMLYLEKSGNPGASLFLTDKNT
jgi:hypothetical protein